MASPYTLAFVLLVSVASKATAAPRPAGTVDDIAPPTSPLLLAPVTEEAARKLFAEHKAEHGKSYGTDEEEKKRFGIFKDNLKFIASRNQDYVEGRITHYLGVNQFTDMTNEEYRSAMLRPQKRTRSLNVQPLDTTDVPPAQDWRKHNAVTPVKNQGSCGSCWSFSTTGSVEGMWAIHSGTLTSLSEQQLMDCSVSEGNMGCDGGLMDQAFEYVIKNGGLDTESDYPYTAMDGYCNDIKAAKTVAYITGYQDVPKDSEDSLKAAVANQPVSVAIEADQSDFQSYSGGVFRDQGCGDQLDHGVLVVGYNVSGSYWLVKNSWGASWGMDGYILMGQGVGNSGICGILSSASYPIINGTKPPHPRPTHEYYYGDPYTGYCNEHETNWNFSAPIGGAACISPCRGLFHRGCDHDLPPDTKAKADCVLQLEGSQHPDYCALVCKDTLDLANSGCPALSTCTPVNGTQVCIYHGNKTLA